MAATIRVKRSEVAGNPSVLAQGELAYSSLAQTLGQGQPATGGNRLYVGTGTETAGDAANHEVIGGKFYVDLLHGSGLPSYGQVLANRAVILDSSGAIDQWTVDNVNINGNTINATSGNLILNAAGVINASSNRITNVTDPTSDQDAATKIYVDTRVTATGSLTINNNVISLEDSAVQLIGSAAIQIVTDSDNNRYTFSIPAGTVTNAMLANSSITIGTDVVNLGGTITDLNGITSLDVDNITIDGNTISSTDGSGILYLDPFPVDSDAGVIVILGDLDVRGTTTTIHSEELTVSDLAIRVANNAVNESQADGAGILAGDSATFTGIRPEFLYDAPNDAWTVNKTIDGTGTSLDSAFSINNIGLSEYIDDHLATNFFLEGEGIDLTYNDGANTLTIAAELATITNPGVASFDSDQMTVTSGAVTIYNLDGGTY